jgi:hypothetical protein
MSKLLEEHRTIWQKEIDANAKKSNEGLEKLFNTYDKRCGERFKDMSDQLNNIENKHQELDKHTKTELSSITERMAQIEIKAQEGKLQSEQKFVETNSQLRAASQALEAESVAAKASYAEMARAVAIAEKVTPPPNGIDLDDFDRALDPTIILANSASNVSKKAVQAALVTLFDDACVPSDQWRVDGAELGRNFTIQLLGAGGIASLRAKKAMGLIKNSDGTFRRHHCKGPEKEEIELYLSGDKNNKRRKIEVLSKKLFRVLQAEHDDKEFHCQRRTGTITVGWRALAKLAVRGPDDFDILWDNAALTAHGITKANILEKFNASAGSAAGVLWEP